MVKRKEKGPAIIFSTPRCDYHGGHREPLNIRGSPILSASGELQFPIFTPVQCRYRYLCRTYFQKSRGVNLLIRGTDVQLERFKFPQGSDFQS
jgi:hypothetical protein